MPWLTDVHMTDVDSSFGYYQLEKDLVYLDHEGKTWVAPAGFIGDMSSIPAFLRPFIPKTILGKTPWIHDYLYKFQPEGGGKKHRKVADILFRSGALDEGMSKKLAQCLYLGLRLGGWVAWNQHKKGAKKKSIGGGVV